MATRKLRVFALGFPKSGTSTLSHALRRAGWRAAHCKVGFLDEFIGRLMYRRLMYRRLYGGVDPLLDLAPFDAVTQCDLILADESCWPQLDPVMMARVRAFHPDCVFLLNYRAPEKVADSIVRWRKADGLTLQQRLVRNGAPGLPIGYASKVANLEYWIRSQYEAMRERYRDDPNFLEYDIEAADAPARLAERLGIALDGWGVRNRNGPRPVERAGAGAAAG